MVLVREKVEKLRSAKIQMRSDAAGTLGAGGGGQS